MFEEMVRTSRYETIHTVSKY